MCWVMPPDSPEATAVSRMASSRLVLPWSTWPMIVTIGARVMRSPGSSSPHGVIRTPSSRGAGSDQIGCLAIRARSAAPLATSSMPISAATRDAVS